MEKFSVRLLASDIAECAVFVALMIAGAFIKIPFPFMPLTFQTVFAVLAGLLLGWRKGMIAMGAYAVMGLIGIPVFSSGGGIFYVTMPSFGYILGFIASAGVAGIAYSRRVKLWQTVLLAIAAFVVDYAFGIAYFIAVWQLNGYSGLWQAVVTYNIFYMPKDAVLTLLAAFLAFAVTPAIKRLRGKAAYKVKGEPVQKNTDK